VADFYGLVEELALETGPPRLVGGSSADAGGSCMFRVVFGCAWLLPVSGWLVAGLVFARVCGAVPALAGTAL
jgi:hypothetical protein